MKEILQDVNFKKAFGIMGGDNNDDEITYKIHKILKTSNMSDDFDWRVTQWKTKHAFQDELTVDETDSYVNYFNAAKDFKVYKNINKLEMNTKTSLEYNKPRRVGEGWIHLLLEQVLDNDKKITFKDMNELIMNIEFKVKKCDNMMSKTDYNPDNHAAQAVWYITVENSKSTDFGPEGRPDYFWFGVPMFDSRECNSQDNHHLDFGTKKLIYSMGYDNFYPEKPVIGKKYRLNYNVLPTIKKAYELAKSNDFLTGANFDDMVIGSMNMGWELPGTFDVEMEIENISISYK